MAEPRMDGTLEQRLLWRIAALREGLSDITSMGSGVSVQVARNALLVDDGNADLCAATALSSHQSNCAPTQGE